MRKLSFRQQNFFIFFLSISVLCYSISCQLVREGGGGNEYSYFMLFSLQAFDSWNIAWLMEIGTERLSNADGTGVNLLTDLLTQALPI